MLGIGIVRLELHPAVGCNDKDDADFEVITSLPYFGVKLSCVCLMFPYRKKLPMVTLR